MPTRLYSFDPSAIICMEALEIKNIIIALENYISRYQPVMALNDLIHRSSL